MTMKQLKPASMDNTCRVVMLGQAAVGKSALVVRYLTRRFIWEYDPTLESTYKHVATLDDESTSVEILDTAGQGNSLHSEGQYRWGDGFILVYSVDNRQSFEEVARLKSKLDDIKKPANATCILVGNKCDLHCTRTVSSSEGEKLALELGCAFFETSACDDEGEITEAFGEIFREVRRRRCQETKPRRRSSGMQMRTVLSKVFTKIQTG